jgi:2,3-dihydroxybenzoate decarboxylase
MDDVAFDPVFARAAALGVPLYLHPSEILPSVRGAYFDPYAATHPMFIRAAWGYTIETGTHAMRLVLGGVLDRHPGLQVILGHLGEGIPYLLERIDEALSRDTPMKNFREIFTRNFHVTTSGFFSTPALRCCMEELGADRVMFSIDAPYASAESGMQWLRGLQLDEAIKTGIAGANARRLLRL